MQFLFDPPPTPSLPIVGSDARFPVHCIYAIGRNYVSHAQEMHSDAVSRSNPVFFLKAADGIVPGGGDIPYPPATHDFQYEVEMVAALHKGGHDIDAARALDCVYGYGIGLDLTRRDLQAEMKARRLPWDVAKSFEACAPVSALRPAKDAAHPESARLSLAVNGQLHQDGNTRDMIFSVAEIIAELSKLYTLKPGDLVFTGTPSGVGPLVRGDAFHAELEGVATLDGRIA